MLFNYVTGFHPAKKSQLCIHWDCIPFVVKCNQSETPVQRKPQNKQQKKPQKRTRMTKQMDMKMRPKAAEKPEANLQYSQKI